MRQIKASEVKPGMTIRWEARGFTHEGPVERVVGDCGGRATRVVNGTHGMSIWNDAEVTVLSEIAQPQPEEPTAFGARVTAGGRRFVRGHGVVWPWIESLDGELYDWRNVCDEGEVTIIDADPSWALPAQVKVAPVVPERIEEWPEDDEALRKHRWKDDWGDTWTWITAYSEWECRNFLGEYQNSLVRPSSGPWTRA